MSDLLGKISSYSLFNYLFSGVLFVALANAFTSYSFIQTDIVLGLFLYYFIGLVMSRFGSLIIEPILKKISFVKFTEYSDYVIASQKDAGLEVLSEVNNTYRTIISVCLGILFLKLYEIWKLKFVWAGTNQIYILLIILLVMFLFAYRKQTSYITKRIKTNLKKNE